MMHPFFIVDDDNNHIVCFAFEKKTNKFAYYPNLFYLCSNYRSNNIKKQT